MRFPNHQFRTVCSAIVAAIAVFLIVGASPCQAQQKWHFGVGTGMTFMNIQGDQGGNIMGYGPATWEIDLDPDEFSDVMESGFGLAGLATDGKWMINYQFASITLGGESSAALPAAIGGGTFNYDLDFDVFNSKLSVGYTAYRSSNFKFAFTPYVGTRYIKHDINLDYSVTQGGTTTSDFRGRDYSWADFLLGTSISYQVGPRVGISASGDAGFGGSEGTFFFSGAMTIKPGKHFAFGPNFSYTAIDYENGEAGDPDWYLYDANEFGVGFFLMLTM